MYSFSPRLINHAWFGAKMKSVDQLSRPDEDFSRSRTNPNKDTHCYRIIPSSLTQKKVESKSPETSELLSLSTQLCINPLDSDDTKLYSLSIIT